MKKRITAQRLIVLEAVKELQSHVSADEVYDAVIKKYPNISRATVYRNLHLLCELGEIHKVPMPSGADRFGLLSHKHYHARCEQCGGVFDVAMEVMLDLEKQIRDSYGFEITGHDILFKGRCPQCVSAARQKSVSAQGLESEESTP